MIGVGGRSPLCAASLSVALAASGWWLAAPAAASSRAERHPDQGYAIVTAGGQIGTFGGAGFKGDLATDPPRSPVVGVAATTGGQGYWLAERDGAVLAFGDATHGSAAVPGSATVAITRSGTGDGFYTVTASGTVHSVDAPAIPAVHVRASAGPVVGIAASRGGVWLATASGAVLASGPVAPVKPPAGRNVVGIASTAGGGGYWLVTSSGRLIPAGDAPVLPAAPHAMARAVAFVPDSDGRGGLVVRTDGSAAAVGDARWAGDASSPLHPPLYPRAYQLPPTGAVGGAALATGPQPSLQGPWRITVIGDSLSAILGQYTRQYVASLHLGGWVSVGGILGCGVVGSLLLGDYSNHRPLEPTLPACGHWQQQYRRSLALSHPDVVVLLLGFWESQRHRLDHQTVTVQSSGAYRSYLDGQLSQVQAMVAQSGARLVVLTAPDYGDGTPTANVAAFNMLLTADFPDATGFDLNSVLDPQGHYQTVVDGVRARGDDHVHLTPAGVERVIDPRLVPLLTEQAQQVIASTPGTRSSSPTPSADAAGGPRRGRTG